MSRPHSVLFILSLALRTVGLSLDDVDLVFADQLEFPSVVGAGAAQAAVSFPPVSLELEREFDFGQIFTTAEISGEVVDVVSLDSNVVDRDAVVATALRMAWDDALALLESDPDPTVEALAARETISAEEMEILLTEVEFITWADQSAQFDKGSVDLACRHAAEILFDLGLISQTASAFGCGARIPG